MARRTGLDTLFDNRDVPTADELLAMANQGGTAHAFELDEEDVNQGLEGVPGEHGSFGDPENTAADEPGRDDNPMSDEDYENLISKGIENAENYIDMELSPDREQAAKYYRGDKFGDEEEGRSAVVMTEVRDTVLAIMPPLLRMFCGTRNAVEFLNNEGTPQDQADQQTAYINHIIHKDNNGFQIFYSTFKDALVRKTGIYTWWYEEKEVVTEEIHTGLNEDAFALLKLEKTEASSEDEYIRYEVEEIDRREDTTAPVPDAAPDPLADPLNPDEPPAQMFIYDARVKKVVIKKRHRVAAVPPEELIVTPITSDNIDEFPLIGRRQMKTIGELVALGHDEAEIREAVGGQGEQSAVSLATNAEAIDRNEAAALERIFDTGFAESDPASEYVKYVVVYVLVDRDGDGILERRKVCTVGDNNKIIYDAIVDEMVPFALICPDPEPHSPFGYSMADQTMDMQEIKSEMVRGILDSLAESIVPRTAIVEGGVNIDDVLSNARGQVVRMKAQGNVQALTQPFVGQNAVPILQWLDDVKARRTGVTMSPAGLSADTLQSTATDAVQATVDASQERAEMIGRIFAETGIKRLMRGLLQQVVKHQDRKRMIRLTGRPITVDPRSFNADLDLEVNVGLGRGTAAKRLGALTMILGQQKEIIQTYGLGNPLVTLHHVSNTMEQILKENDMNDVSRYMNVLSADDAKKLAAAEAAQPKPPTPEELLFKAQQAKTEADLEKSRNSEETNRISAVAKLKFDYDKLESDMYIKMADILGKYGIKLTEQELRARMAHDDATTAMANDAASAAQEQITAANTPPSPVGGQ